MVRAQGGDQGNLLGKLSSSPKGLMTAIEPGTFQVPGRTSIRKTEQEVRETSMVDAQILAA